MLYLKRSQNANKLLTNSNSHFWLISDMIHWGLLSRTLPSPFASMTSRQVSQEMIFICLKFGITHQSMQIDKSNPNVLTELNQSATDIVSKKLDNLDGGSDRYHIKLFLISGDHQPASLKLITRPSDLTPACFIEIVIWRSDQSPFVAVRDHVLAEHSYKKPTYCSSCDYFMWGLIKQVCQSIRWGRREDLCLDFH